MFHSSEDWIAAARAIPIEKIAPQGLKRQGRELVGPCPRCGGTDRFSINPDKGIFHCRGCDKGGEKGGNVIKLAQFLWDLDFIPAVERLTGEPRPKSNGKDHGETPWQTEGEYIYRDADEKPYLKVVRKRKPDGTKSYPQYHIEDGRWVSGKPSGPKIPYRLPELLDADRTEPVFITEGEKCADRLAKDGFAVSTASEGAGKWTADLNQHFAGRIVWIIPDADEPGRRHAQQVAANLHGIAAEVRIVEISGLKDGEDVYDFLDGAGTADELRRLGDSAPLWVPAPSLDPSQDKPSGRLVVTQKEFLAGFVPPEYLVDGILQRGFLYSLTGATGAGKSAIALLLAALISHPKGGQKLGPHEVEHGRIVYIARENPTDIRMRMIGMAAKLGFEPDPRDYLVIHQPSDILDKDLPRIVNDIKEFGDVAAVFVDTSAAVFPGDDENNNPQMGNHARNTRKLCDLPGHPTVLTLCHPTKRPQGKEDLIPRGGGAFIAEVDGNLTALLHDGNLVDLHCTGKFRGPDFEPITFQLVSVNTTKLLDKKGRIIPTVMAKVVTAAQVEETEEKAIFQENALLAAMVARPEGSLAKWAVDCGWFPSDHPDQPYKSLVQRVMERLVKDIDDL